MTTGHKNIVDAQRHECKGATAATIGQTIISNGDATATFQYAHPRGSSYFVDMATPYTLSYPSAYTKLAPTTTSTGTNIQFTVSTSGRLTYTGTRTLTTKLIFNISLDQASGSNRDIEVAVYKNGSLVPGSTVVNTTSSAIKVLTTCLIDTTMATNDYVEAFVKNAGAGGDVRVYSFYLSAVGLQ